MVTQEVDYKKKFFQHLDDLTVDKKPWDRSDSIRIESYSIFLVNKFLSTVKLLVPYVEQANSLKSTDKENHYNFLLNILPKRKFYCKSFKASKDYDKDLIESICKYFECNISDAIYKERYLEESHKEYLLNIYGKKSSKTSMKKS